MKISILGTRGIPANYGGFETFAQELSERLAERGHQITVYCRSYGRKGFFSSESYQSKIDYRGSPAIQLRYVPTLYHKYLETILHSFFSFLDCLRQNPDVIILCNAANSPWIPVARLRGIPVAVNVDGVERRRSEWNFFGRAWYRMGEICSVLFGSRIISDAQVIADYYCKTYGVQSEIIAYGAERKFVPCSGMHQEFRLTPKRFILYVSRLEPENNCLGVIKAYLESGVCLPLVIIGDAPYAEKYKEALQAQAAKIEMPDENRRIVFCGFRFGESYRELREHCYLYIQASEVGGTHPALVEAMAHANCIIANDVPEHREVLEDAGYYYKFNNFTDLAGIIRQLAADPNAVTNSGAKAFELAKKKYSWETVTDKYENLCNKLMAARHNTC